MSTTFSSLGLSEPLIQALAKQGFSEPFPIQSAAIPGGIAGRDIQCKAPTGSGKTLAFGLPMVSNVGKASTGRPRALVLAPTRELAEQIRRDLDPFARAAGRRITAIYGGVGYGEQKRALRGGVDVLVATPGRLEDLMNQGVVDLSDVDIVTIDEADRMADMGFLPAVRRILTATRRDRQTLLFSATLDGEVAVLAGKSQHDPMRVLMDAVDELELDVTHRFWQIDRSERLARAIEIVNSSDRTIVFTRTRRGADRLVKQFAKSGLQTVALHGGRSQNQRTRALRAFSAGRVGALVATDVAARGIHVDDVDVVLHYDLPKDPKDYVHRSGRTGRAGANGMVVSLVLDGQEGEARRILRATGVASELESPGSIGARRDGASPQPRRPVAQARQSTRRPGGSTEARTLSIFIGNLPWRVSDAELESLFAEHGPVEGVEIATHNGSGKSKGYGFVDMETLSAKEAIRHLNGSVLDGRKIRVRPAR